MKEIKNKVHAHPEVVEHLRAAINTILNAESPINGYAIVSFHDNMGFIATHHSTTMNVHQIDIPDMVKNRLMQSAIVLALNK